MEIRADRDFFIVTSVVSELVLDYCLILERSIVVRG